MKKAGYILMLALMACSCSHNVVYSHYESLPVSGWPADSALEYNFSIADSTQAYDMVLNFRHSEVYPYQNVWLFTDLYYGEQLLKSDTLEFFLADARGRWLGNGTGSLKDMPMLYRRRVVYPKTGDYRVVVRQGMREERLKGVREVGFTLSYYEE